MEKAVYYTFSLPHDKEKAVELYFKNQSNSGKIKDEIILCIDKIFNEQVERGEKNPKVIIGPIYEEYPDN